MKNQKTILGVMLCSLGAALSGSSALAYNPYGIEYAGGSPLGSGNVQVIDQSVMDSIKPLLNGDDVVAMPSDSTKWSDGYIKDLNQCKKAHYFIYNNAPEPMLMSTSSSSANSDYEVVFSNASYSAVATINDIYLESGGSDVSTKSENRAASSANGAAIAILNNSNTIYGGVQIYNDATCTEPDYDTSNFNPTSGDKLFLDLTINFYKNETEEPYQSDSLYFGLTDIDAAQSFKILSTENPLVPENMYTVDMANLQPNNGSSLRNMYVQDGNYIYSEYDPTTGEVIATQNISNIYTRLAAKTQTEGLNIVFGFASGAGSGIEYYERVSEAKEDPSIVVPNTGTPTGEVNAMLIPVSIIGVSAFSLLIRFLPQLSRKKVDFNK